MKSRAYAALAAKTDLVPYEFERRELGSNDVALDIKLSTYGVQNEIKVFSQ